MTHSSIGSLCIGLFALISAPAFAADTAVPAKDLSGLKDVPGLPRYQNSVLVFRDEVDYDEMKFPIAAVKYGRTPDDLVDTMRLLAPQTVAAQGRRNRLIYAAPAGRSHLEVLRNYQNQLSASGYKTLFECAGETCGDGTDAYVSDSSRYFANFVFPQSEWKLAESNSPQGCSVGLTIKNVRYAVLRNAGSGETVALFLHSPDIQSVYCDEVQWQSRAIITVDYIKPKAIESNMVTVDADAMGKSITQNGRVALYGILFDTAKAEIKPASKPALDEIAKLMRQNATMQLHVVGHTDNQGVLQSNFDLSRRRAEAVKNALITQYGIAARRLTANGVASLAPVASNESEDGRAKNRRVELVLF